LEQTKEATNFIPYLNRSYWLDLVSRVWLYYGAKAIS
jgi:hypothetical protein